MGNLMSHLNNNLVHTFHIPVMGTGFTIDTPLHVARYGISSVISLVDDILIEQMRKYHSLKNGEPYSEISGDNVDARSQRITAYLNLLDRIVARQVEDLRNSPFEDGSEISLYFRMLPDSPLKKEYHDMLDTPEGAEKERRCEALRRKVRPGSIDVNVMTKLDCLGYRNGVQLPPEYSDAKTALKGFAESTVDASIVCSAGMNRGFYKSFAKYGDFFPDKNGVFRKRIVLKVSDVRSAEMQGNFLAKMGLWVSEYRIESGLNCGGHAFATKGSLLGPIMAEFRDSRESLCEKLNSVYADACSSHDRIVPDNPLDFRITVQGGIGTAEEDRMLLTYYNVDGTGWGTPFMLVPDVVNVDDEHLALLASASDDDVYLSNCSPLGVPFWNLRTSASERARRQRIENGTPGSVCRKGYLKFNADITERPICRASVAYQKKRLAMIENEDLTAEQYNAARDDVLSKSCICDDLAGGATIRAGIEPDATPAVCCGPNIVNFSKIMSLSEMIDHIYGRISVLVNPDRPHMFVRELKLYVEYLQKEVDQFLQNLSNQREEYLIEFKKNLLAAIDYYLNFAEKIVEKGRDTFIQDLYDLKAKIENITLAHTANCHATI